MKYESRIVKTARERTGEDANEPANLVQLHYVDFITDMRQARTNLSVNMMPNDLPTDAICSPGIPARTLTRIILVTSGYDDNMNNRLNNY